MKSQKPLVPVAACLVVQLCAGIIYLWSVFRTAVTQSFFWTPEASTMVAPLMLFGFTIGNFIGGTINDRKGPRKAIVPGVALFAIGIALTGLIPRGVQIFGTNSAFLIYVFYCAIGGLGSGIASSACISCIQKWMPDRCGLATGLAASAFGLSNVVFAPFSRFLMKSFTVAETGLVNFTAVFLIMAGIFSVLGFAACLFIRLPPWETAGKRLEARPAAAGEADLPLPKAMKTVTFWMIFAALFFYNGTWNLASPIIYDLGLERGVSTALATLCVSITGIGNASGRLIMGTVSDRLGRIPTTLLLCFLTLASAICMVFAKGLPYIATVFLIAFTYGGPAALFPAMTSDFFGRNNYGMNYGVLIQGLGLSSIFFNLLSTRILQSRPVPTFIMAAGTAIAAMIPLYIVFRIQKRRAAEKK